MSIKLSVIIGSFNQCEVLKKVLPHYEHQNCPKEKFEVIVVDSTSTDGAVDFLKKYNPAFNFTAHIQDNAGKAIARNNGVSLAKGEIVLITDADMIPDPGLVQAHIDAHNAQETPCCFEGLAWNMKTLNWPDNQDEWTAQVGTDPKQLKKLGWYYFLTGNLSMPKSVFIEENGFNTQFLGYGWEDLELGYRLQKKGILLRYLKTGINYHYHVISEDDEIQRNEKKGESAKIMLQLHPELKIFLGLNPLSQWLFPKIQEQGRFYQWMKTQWFPSKNKIKHDIAFWFLKEYQYLKGILK